MTRTENWDQPVVCWRVSTLGWPTLLIRIRLGFSVWCCVLSAGRITLKLLNLLRFFFCHPPYNTRTDQTYALNDWFWSARPHHLPSRTGWDANKDVEMLAVNISLSLTTVHCCVLSQIERERRPASWKVFSSCSSGDWRVETGGSVSVLMTLHHLHHTRYLMTQESSQLTLILHTFTIILHVRSCFVIEAIWNQKKD